MTEDHPQPPALPSGRTLPVVEIILGLWVAIWLLMMWHGDWPWAGQRVFDFGSPRRSTLKLFGALIPADFRWQSVFLAPLLHASLLGLVFLLFFWRSTGRTLVMFVGPSWTWVTFVLGGAAAAYGHLQAHPHGALPWAVGPFDPILCAVGVQLGWGLMHREARQLTGRAIKTLLFICIWMVVMMLLSGVPLSELGSPRMLEAMGAEGMLAALVAGIALAFLIGIPRRIAPGATVWLGRGLAIVLALGVAGAMATQAEPILKAGKRAEAEDFLEHLRRVERGVSGMLDQSQASSVMRDELAVHHARLLAHPFLEGFDGRDDLLAYAKILGAYLRPVEAPFLTEPQLKKRYGLWYSQHEKPLRARFALPQRPYDPWKRL